MILFLDIKGMIFWRAPVKWLTCFIKKYKYMGTLIQNSGVAGILGFMEHTRFTTQLLREAKENKIDLVTLWLDLIHAYSLLLHKVIRMISFEHHVPIKILLQTEKNWKGWTAALLLVSGKRCLVMCVGISERGEVTLSLWAGGLLCSGI